MRKHNQRSLHEEAGYSGARGYSILGTSPIEGPPTGVVDIPNACHSVFVATEISDFGIRPGGHGPKKVDRGDVARTPLPFNRSEDGPRRGTGTPDTCGDAGWTPGRIDVYRRFSTGELDSLLAAKGIDTTR